jgi:hypothetical protein
LLYLVKNYRVTVKTLNLLHNQIDEVLSSGIRHYVENECDFDTSEIKTLPTFNGDSQNYDIKTRDQLKVDKYVQNGNS